MSAFTTLVAEVRACTICAEHLPHLPHEPRPVIQLHPQARILIAGQAPGRKVHESLIPFDDASGDRLREWLGVSSDVFYDPRQIALVPMGFCFPGTGKGGDLAPRPECAPAWRARLLASLTNLELTLAVGRYAHDYHFAKPGLSVTERVQRWPDYWPHAIPLPHPSPRNNLWLRRNPWFDAELIPALRKHVAKVLGC